MTEPPPSRVPPDDFRNDFRRDDAWQRAQRDKFMPQYYRAYGCRYEFLDPDHPSGADTWWWRPWDGDKYVEEKFARWKGVHHDAFAIEVMSNSVPGRERIGWIDFRSPCRAEVLMYGFVQPDGYSMRAHFLSLPLLREWFWRSGAVWRFPPSIGTQINQGFCVVVKLVAIMRAMEEMGAPVEVEMLRVQDVSSGGRTMAGTRLEARR